MRQRPNHMGVERNRSKKVTPYPNWWQPLWRNNPSTLTHPLTPPDHQGEWTQGGGDPPQLALIGGDQIAKTGARGARGIPTVDQQPYTPGPPPAWSQPNYPGPQPYVFPPYPSYPPQQTQAYLANYPPPLPQTAQPLPAHPMGSGGKGQRPPPTPQQSQVPPQPNGRTGHSPNYLGGAGQPWGRGCAHCFKLKLNHEHDYKTCRINPRNASNGQAGGRGYPTPNSNPPTSPRAAPKPTSAPPLAL
jgi:hypothetical protein